MYETKLKLVYDPTERIKRNRERISRILMTESKEKKIQAENEGRFGSKNPLNIG